MTVSRIMTVASIIAIISLAAAVALVTAADYDKATNSDSSCTKGRLWISETTAGTVRAYSLDNGMGVVGSFAATTAANTNLYTIETGHAVAAVTRGTVAKNYTDGVVRFYTAGLDGATAVAPAQHSFRIDCVSPVHFTSSHGYGWLAVFCDGFYSTTDPYHINATANYLNEEHLYDTTSTVDSFTWKIPSAHHGVAWAMDEDHFLYSVATQARRNRGSTDSLPAGFVLNFRNGTEVHDLNDIEDTHASCHGFHGESHVHNRFAFGCDSSIDDTHDGILVVTKNEHAETYTSKKLSYPGNIGTARTSTIYSNEHTEYFIGNFGSFLLAFTGDETTSISSTMAQNITGSCAWNVEKSQSGYVFYLASTGIMYVYTVSTSGWKLDKTITVFSTPITCTTVTLVPGWGIVAVLRRDVTGVTYVNLAGGTTTHYPLSYSPQTGTIIAEEESFCRACDACLDGNGNAAVNGASSATALPALAVAGVIGATVAAMNF